MHSTINGIRLHHESAGEGPFVVLVHGLATSLAFWYLGVVPPLARRFRVVAYDMRGHGLSEMPATGYTVSDLASDLRGLMDHLGVERAHIVGHSFGAAVALGLAAADPGRVWGLVLADAVVPRLGAGAAGGREQLSLRYLVELGDIAAGRRNGSGLPAGSHAGSSAERWSRLLATTSAPTELATRDLTPSTLGRIRRPALIVVGERSRVRGTSRRLQALLADSRYEVVPGAGHFHPLARPRDFASRTAAFLSELERNGRL